MFSFFDKAKNTTISIYRDILDETGALSERQTIYENLGARIQEDNVPRRTRLQDYFIPRTYIWIDKELDIRIGDIVKVDDNEYIVEAIRVRTDLDGKFSYIRLTIV